MLRPDSPAHGRARPGGRGSQAGRKRPMVPSIRHEDTESAPEPSPWRDRADRTVYPLPFPEVTVDPGVFVPTECSFLCWKYLFSERIGESKTCLDMGCGCGILAIQRALNVARQA